MDEAADLYERLDIGCPYTDVECPECGELCYPKALEITPVSLRLTLYVDYAPHGEAVDTLRGMLLDIAEHAAKNGLLTHESSAEITTWHAAVEQIKK